MPSIGPTFKGIDWQPAEERAGHAGKPWVDFKHGELEYTYPDGRQAVLNDEDLARLWSVTGEYVVAGKPLPGRDRQRALEQSGDFYKRVGDFLEPYKPE